MSELVQVAMRSFDLARSGANNAETVLTPAAVRTRGIVKLHTLQVAGDSRGCEAQPLIVTLAGKSAAVLCTMGNVVEAFDVASGTPLWRIGPDVLGTPIKGTTAIDAWQINDNWGILSTPVIDLTKIRLYACVWSSPDASVDRSSFSLVEIDLTAGKVLRTCPLQSATYTPGHGLPIQRFDKAQRKQRAALTLSNDMVHVPFGTIAETSDTAQGWMVAVDTDTMTITCAWASTCRGQGGGIWQAGEGPAVDSAGNLIFTTANGDFDGITDFGECVVKLGVVDGQYKVLDWWSPWSDEEREGGAAVDVAPMPTNYRNRDQWGDQDLGSAAPTLMEDLDLVIVGCKDGIAYPVRHSNMGKTMPADFADKAKNYYKLAGPAIFATFPGMGYDAEPQDATKLNFYLGGFTHHQHAAMTRFGDVVFVQGENEVLKAYRVNSYGDMAWLADGAQVASANCAAPPGGMPGGMTALSSNGDTNGLLFVSIPYADGNMTVGYGRFLVYDAQDFSGGTIKLLWDSERWADKFVYNKFNVPVPVNGYVLLPCYDGTVRVYGLAQ